MMFVLQSAVDPQGFASGRGASIGVSGAGKVSGTSVGVMEITALSVVTLTRRAARSRRTLIRSGSVVSGDW